MVETHVHSGQEISAMYNRIYPCLVRKHYMLFIIFFFLFFFTENKAWYGTLKINVYLGKDGVGVGGGDKWGGGGGKVMCI